MNKVWSVYFSPTGNSKKVALALGKELANTLDFTWVKKSFTLPEERQNEIKFSQGDIVVLAMPVIAGRVPNLLLSYLASLNLKGTLYIPLVTYGNRSFDDALRELSDIGEDLGAITIGAAAFPALHSFSTILGAGRPSQTDFNQIKEMALSLRDKIKKIVSSKNLTSNSYSISGKISGRDRETRAYYKPLDKDGNYIDIRKVKPITLESCDYCMWCAKNCPLGSISMDNPQNVEGICMKCCACIKGCHKGAKAFVDEGFLYHKKDLEALYGKINRQIDIFL